jgi:hypothetical protein
VAGLLGLGPEPQVLLDRDRLSSRAEAYRLVHVLVERIPEDRFGLLAHDFKRLDRAKFNGVFDRGCIFVRYSAIARDGYLAFVVQRKHGLDPGTT